MIYYLRKEILEVEDVFRAVKKKSEPPDNIELVKELGDVLFDVLMLIEVTGREHGGVSLEACTRSACAKVVKRCPYIDWHSPNGGATAKTVAEAEAAWQSAKRTENDKTSTALDVVPPAPLSTSLAPQTEIIPHADSPAHKSLASSAAAASAAIKAAAAEAHGAAGAVQAELLRRRELLATELQREELAETCSTAAKHAVSRPAAHAVARQDELRSAVRSSGAEDDDSGSGDGGFAEWEADFRRAAGPPSISDSGSETE